MTVVGAPFWAASIVLVLSAAPCVSADGAAGKHQSVAGELTKGRQTGREAGILPIVGGSDADMQERYLAARRATDMRERDWDRRMKQLTKDVCTGC